MIFRRGRNLFLFVSVFLVCFLSFAYAEPPIEVFYFKPSDVETPTQDDLDSIHDTMVTVQDFFASEMDRHGFGLKTFNFTPEIKVIKGKQKLNQYTSHWTIERESNLIQWGLDNQIYVVFFGGYDIGGTLALSQRLCANIPEQLIYCNNLVVIPSEIPEIILPLTAHEIGHAFSINEHPSKRLITGKVDIMYHPLHVIPGIKMTLKDFVLSNKDAIFLDKGGRLSIQEPTPILDQEIDADVNDDGYVDLHDVRIVRSGTQNSTSYDTDINNDGVTDEIDVMIVKAAAHAAISAAAPRKQKVKLTTTWAALKKQ